MADNLTLKIMANLAARQGFAPPPAAEGGAAGANAPAAATARLQPQDEQMLLRAIGGAKPAPPGQSRAAATGGCITLDELAEKKR